MRRAALHEFICFFRIADRPAMRDELLRRHPTLFDQAEEGVHVALFRPAHIGQGIIVAAEFVTRIAAAGAIGHRSLSSSSRL